MDFITQDALEEKVTERDDVEFVAMTTVFVVAPVMYQV